MKRFLARIPWQAFIVLRSLTVVPALITATGSLLLVIRAFQTISKPSLHISYYSIFWALSGAIVVTDQTVMVVVLITDSSRYNGLGVLFIGFIATSIAITVVILVRKLLEKTVESDRQFETVIPTSSANSHKASTPRDNLKSSRQPIDIEATSSGTRNHVETKELRKSQAGIQGKSQRTSELLVGDKNKPNLWKNVILFSLWFGNIS
mmetsp:Transcript_11704/g.16195  ORF Transcript_11704/g.16195 Transcript_11704/m.16195 type:complete len:207 (-) Transcript_11704:409-1029(-)